MNRFARTRWTTPAFWRAPLLARLVAEGKAFQQAAACIHHRIKEFKMTSAVIVSTARTPLAKSWKGFST